MAIIAQSVATVTVVSSCTFAFKWSQVRIHKASLLFFFWGEVFHLKVIM